MINSLRMIHRKKLRLFLIQLVVQALAPPQVEGEHGILQHLLGHHVVKNRLSGDLGQIWVTHPQNPVKLRQDKRITGLIDRLPKLLVQGRQIPYLKQKTHDDTSHAEGPLS